MVSVTDPTRRRLITWGHWAQGGLRGYPTAAAFLMIVRGSDSPNTPPDILETEGAVNRTETPLRIVLIKEFCHRGSRREKAAQVDLPKTTYDRRLDEALWFVHTELERVDARAKNTLQSGNMAVGVPETPYLSRRVIKIIHAALNLPALNRPTLRKPA